MIDRALLIVSLSCCLATFGCEEGEENTDSGSGGTDSSSGGVDSSTGSELPEVDYEADVQPIWNANCTCHLMGQSGTMTAPVLTLNPGMSHAQLVGIAAEQAPDLVRVTAGDLDASYVWRKLNGTHLDVGGSGTAMPPPPTPALDDATLATIEAWIVGGAQP